MNPLSRLLWKSIPKAQRQFLLQRLSIVDQQSVNKVLSGGSSLLSSFKQNNCIFIHGPKCAGTSICQAIFAAQRPGHVPFTWFEAMYPDFYSDAFKFAFVRDPLERALSAFNYLREDRGIRRDNQARQLVNSFAGFDDFARGWLCAENAQRQIHFAPQWLFLVNAMGQLELDFIGRQESIATDFSHVCQRLGVNGRLGHANRSGGALAADSCSNESKAIIADVYRRDYSLLGYADPLGLLCHSTAENLRYAQDIPQSASHSPIPTDAESAR